MLKTEEEKCANLCTFKVIDEELQKNTILWQLLSIKQLHEKVKKIVKSKGSNKVN